MSKLPRKYLPLYIIGSLLLIFGVVLGSFIAAYHDRYYPRVSVAGIALAGKTKDQGKKEVDKAVATYLNHGIVLSVPDISKPRLESTGDYPEIEMKATAKELGLSFQSDYVAREAWRVGHTSSIRQWVSQTATTIWSGTKLNLPYTVDKNQINTYIMTNVRPKIVVPKPASLTVDKEKVVMNDPSQGMEVDEAALTQLIIHEMDNAKETDASYIRIPVKYVDSPITRQTLEPLKTAWEKMGGKNYQLKVKYQDQDKTASPTKVQRLQWFSVVQDDKGVVSLAVNNDGVDKYLKSQSGLPINYSKSLTTLSKALVNLLNDAQKNKDAASLSVELTAKPEPTKAAEPGQVTLGKYEGKYVEVNLADQKLYLINGSTLEKTYRVSSGKASTPTPKGEFSIKSKTARAYSASYGLYMPYWQNFLNGEYGLHELPEWPNGYKEGEAHIGTPVSHGCVRLGVGDAKEVYDWTEIGTPVYIH